MLNELLDDKIDKPLISIIVPVYNVEKYIDDCVKSIINQTYKNLEIILVDDGSTDKSGSICDTYKKLDKRIKVIHQKNAGQGWARNSGMNVASGKYFGFVDSDDLVFPQMYEFLVQAIINSKADISACTREQIDETFSFEQTETRCFANDFRIEIFSGKLATKELLESHKKFKNAVWEKLYKRELFNDIKFRSVYAEDCEVMYKLLYSSQTIAYIPLKLYGYRLREGSTMLSKWTDFKDDCVYEQDKDRLAYFKNIGDKELINAAIYWHIFWGVENYRRLKGQPKKYIDRLKKEMKPYGGTRFLFSTDYPFRRKVEFWIFTRNPEFHYRVCNLVRKIKAL